MKSVRKNRRRPNIPAKTATFGLPTGYTVTLTGTENTGNYLSAQFAINCSRTKDRNWRNICNNIGKSRVHHVTLFVPNLLSIFPFNVLYRRRKRRWVSRNLYRSRRHLMATLYQRVQYLWNSLYL
uniref:Uncharacterized protein n=1 Tax=Cacopsylla melanoneura TaxID=428564 RepID=A0A8D9AT34_9HEMI